MEISDNIKRIIWNKSTRPIVGYDINYYGLDYLNNVIHFNDYDNRDSLYGWELDHILPKSLGGLDVISNLRALHWQSNASLGGHLGKIF
jgi:5-methylcytosine-specific restriction endonuclease McrA